MEFITSHAKVLNLAILVYLLFQTKAHLALSVFTEIRILPSYRCSSVSFFIKEGDEGGGH